MHKSSLSIRRLVDEVFRSGDLNGDDSLVNKHSRAVRTFKKEMDSIKHSQEIIYDREISYEKNIGANVFDLKADIDVFYEPEFSQSGVATILKVVVIKENIDNYETMLDLMSWSEVRATAALVALVDGYDRVNAKIRWYHRDTMDFIEREEFYKKEDLNENLDNLITQYLEWNNIFAGWPLVRDKSIAEFEFPYQPYRPGQREMMAQVYRSIRDEEHAMIEAPTGIGKTLGTLFPAIKALGENKCEKIFYLTARTTGRQIAMDALNMMQAKGLRIKYLEITSKEKICFRKSNPKDCDDCPYMKDYYDRVKDGLAKAFDYDALDRVTIESISEEFDLCPFEFSLDVSLTVDCIICDYNYAFDPRVSLERFFDEVKSKYVFLIDEAHNLIDRSRNMFSNDISTRAIDMLLWSIEDHLPDQARVLKKLVSEMDVIKRQVEDNYRNFNQGVVLHSVPSDLLDAVKMSVRTLGAWLELNDRANFYKNMSDMYYQLSSFMALTEDTEYSSDYCLLCDFWGDGQVDLNLNLFCLNPADKLAEVFKRSSTSIMFSATLKPFEYFSEVLGFGNECKKLSLSSPFPRKNLNVKIAPIDTTYKNRKFTADDVVIAIEQMLEFKPGNYMVFFPSYSYMQTIYDLFEERNCMIDSFIQEPSMSEEDRNDFINRFSLQQGDDAQTQLAFAVMGGVFSEGIDLVGDKLVGVAIVGVGMPGLSIERNEIKNYYAERYKHNKYIGFEYSYTYPGMTKVLQSAGRVIRSETDKGVVVLIDQRFMKFPYKNLLPDFWKIEN